MILNENIKEAIKQEALSSPLEEVCGFIYFNLSLSCKCLHRCTNSTLSKGDFFSISPLDYVRASEKGEILAVYHSHINENIEFSLSDRINANNHDMPFILYNIKKDIFNEYLPNDYVNPYVGREFTYGKSDCFSLIKDYYAKELSIEIIDNFTNRTEKWFEENSNAFFDGWKRDNPKFYLVTEPQKHDLLLFNYFRMIKAPHHLGIYLGDNIFLHHPRNKYSIIERYSDNFIKRTMHILRYDKS